jgi:L-3-cyanoalanine synthase/cysteine synthase
MSIEIGPHDITGNGVGFKPDILDMDVMEKVLEVSTAELKERVENKCN